MRLQTRTIFLLWESIVAYKKLYVDGGYAIVGYNGYKIPSNTIEISSSRLTHYEDEDGRLIPYNYPMFRYDLECELSNGYFHVVIHADEHHIISFKSGSNAEGDGDNWNLEKLSITYGRDPFINNLYSQF